MKTLILFLLIAIVGCKVEKGWQSYPFSLVNKACFDTTSFQKLTGYYLPNTSTPDSLLTAKQKECKHYTTATTAMWCPGESCNTVWCLNCGKRWNQ